MDEGLIQYAEEMKKKYFSILADYSIEQIIEVWKSYSEQACAGWLSSHDHKTIFSVFSQAPTYFKYKEGHPREDNDYDNYSGWYYNWK